MEVKVGWGMGAEMCVCVCVVGGGGGREPELVSTIQSLNRLVYTYSSDADGV